MKTFHFLFLAAISGLALTGCDQLGGTGDDSTGLVDCTGTETIVTNIDFSCDTSGWHYWAETEGWTTSAAVEVDQNTDNPWHEEHTLASEASGGPDGQVNHGEADAAGDACWDNISRDLALTTDFQAQEADTNSLFTCEMQTGMMFMLSVYDLESNKSDCAVWGSDVSIYATNNCLNWNQ